MSRLEELAASELTKMLKSKLEALWKNEVASSMPLSGNIARAAPPKVAAAAFKKPLKKDPQPLSKVAAAEIDFEEWLEQPAFPVEIEKRRENVEHVHREPSPPARIMRVTSPTPATTMTGEAPEKKERGDSSPVNEDRRAPPKKEPTTEDESEKKDGETQRHISSSLLFGKVGQVAPPKAATTASMEPMLAAEKAAAAAVFSETPPSSLAVRSPVETKMVDDSLAVEPQTTEVYTPPVVAMTQSPPLCGTVEVAASLLKEKEWNKTADVINIAVTVVHVTSPSLRVVSPPDERKTEIDELPMTTKETASSVEPAPSLPLETAAAVATTRLTKSAKGEEEGHFDVSGNIVTKEWVSTKNDLGEWEGTRYIPNPRCCSWKFRKKRKSEETKKRRPDNGWELELKSFLDGPKSPRSRRGDGAPTGKETEENARKKMTGTAVAASAVEKKEESETWREARGSPCHRLGGSPPKREPLETTASRWLPCIRSSYSPPGEVAKSSRADERKRDGDDGGGGGPLLPNNTRQLIPLHEQQQRRGGRPREAAAYPTGPGPELKWMMSQISVGPRKIDVPNDLGHKLASIGFSIDPANLTVDLDGSEVKRAEKKVGCGLNEGIWSQGKYEPSWALQGPIPRPFKGSLVRALLCSVGPNQEGELKPKAIVGQIIDAGNEGLLKLGDYPTTKSMETITKAKEEQFSNSYFVDFEKEEEELFVYGTRDVCHEIREELKNVGVEEVIRELERNWKRRKRKVKEVEVNYNLEVKVVLKGDGM